MANSKESRPSHKVFIRVGPFTLEASGLGILAAVVAEILMGKLLGVW